MKKVMIIAVICMVSVTAFGQVKFGIKAGGNISNLSGDIENGRLTTRGNKLTGGLHVGGYANYSFTDMLGVQVEVVFSMQGGKEVWENDGAYWTKNDNGENVLAENINGVLRLNYINAPLLLDIKPFKVPVSFFAGPQFGYCVSRSFDGNNVDDKLYEDFDFSIACGVQYTLIEHLTLGLRCNIGLTPSINYNYDYDYEFNNEIFHAKNTVKSSRNNVLQLSAGWTF